MQPLRGTLRAGAGDELLHLRQNTRDDDVDAGGIGMQPVVLQKLQIGGSAVEEERINKNVIFGRKVGIDAFERSPVFGAEIWRRAHAAKEHRDMARGETAQNVI